MSILIINNIPYLCDYKKTFKNILVKYIDKICNFDIIII